MKRSQTFFKFKVIFFVFIITGCGTVTNKYYAPQVKWSELVTVSAGNNKFEIFQRTIADGITLEMIGPFDIIFRLDRGKSIRFTSNLVSVVNKETGVASKILIEKINQGEKFDEGKFHYVAAKSFSPLAEFRGSGEFSKVDMCWGCWSKFEGREDVFRIKLSKYALMPEQTVIVGLPAFYAQGVLIKIEPIEFKWKESISFQAPI